MARWTVSIGDEVAIVIERTADGDVAIDIPSGKRVIADRATVEDFRLKLGAAISIGGDSHD